MLLGAGKSLFSDADRDKQMLRLRESQSYPNGIVKLVYDVVALIQVQRDSAAGALVQLRAVRPT